MNSRNHIHSDHLGKRGHPWVPVLLNPRLAFIIAHHVTLPEAYPEFPAACPAVFRSWLSLKVFFLQIQTPHFILQVSWIWAYLGSSAISSPCLLPAFTLPRISTFFQKKNPRANHIAHCFVVKWFDYIKMQFWASDPMLCLELYTWSTKATDALIAQRVEQQPGTLRVWYTLLWFSKIPPKKKNSFLIPGIMILKLFNFFSYCWFLK